jgi:hypothetical protein
MTPGQATADRLAAKHRRDVRPVCTACDARVAFVVPAYWNPTVVRLCSACCAVWCEDHPDERSWPAGGRWTPSRLEDEGAVA